MDSEEGKQLASGMKAMAKADVDEIAQPSGWHDNEETKTEHTDGANSSFLSEWGDRVRVSSDYLIALC